MNERIETMIARAVKQVPHPSSPLNWSLLESRDLKRLVQLAGAALAHAREVEHLECQCQVCWAIQEINTGVKRGKPVQMLDLPQEADAVLAR